MAPDLLLLSFAITPADFEIIDFPGLRAGNFPAMILTILHVLSMICASFRLRSELGLENLALRHYAEQKDTGPSYSLSSLGLASILR